MSKVKKSGELSDVRRTKGTSTARATKGAPKAGKVRKAGPAPKAAKQGRKEKAKPVKAMSATRATARPARAKPVAKRPAKGKPTTKARVTKRVARPKGRPTRPVTPPEVQIKIRELNPFQMCGAGTSVVRLIRVDEVTAGVLRAHLVFFDKHGWYCEHGRTCPAVRHAQKHAQHVARPQ